MARLLTDAEIHAMYEEELPGWTIGPFVMKVYQRVRNTQDSKTAVAMQVELDALRAKGQALADAVTEIFNEDESLPDLSPVIDTLAAWNEV